jgi:acyl transferase domain-containing protein
MALAGGVDIRTPQKSGQRFEEGGVFSNDGHCRPFDASATGTMFGEGAGAVVLKRLEDALRDNDTIHAVIKGAAVNHDGGHKVSYLAPSVEGQARVIASALGMAGVSPETITYVEAHGTATPIGDPIEVEALTRVYRAFTQGRRYCAIGSIKGNFGHATTAAGIAGILKVVLAMRHRQIPATLHFKRPNPRIDFASSPFFVNDKLLAWEPRHNLPRRATVSSFGFCGTNAHIVLEEAPKAPESADPSRPFQLFLLSARNPAALDGGVGRMTSALTTMSANSMADAAYTTHVGRKRFECRRCVVLRDPAEAPEFLSQASGARSASLKSDSSNTSVAFVFPGQGAQYINMGRTLYQGEPVFREAIDRCSIELQPHLECDLREYLFPAPGDSERAKQALNNTFYTQPAIFTIGYALASQFMHWGIQPKAFIGHSIGEFLGATVAGVMALEEALRLVATRGRLMQGLPGGSMLTVRLPLDSLLSRLPPDVDVAAVNGPELIVVAGPTQALEAFSQVLASEGIMTRMLHTSHAFHSSMMDPVVEPFLRVVESVKLSAAQLPFVSTVTGDWAKAADVADPNYWAKHLRSPVLFSRAIQVLLADEKQVVLECGPRRTCSTLALQHRPKNPGRIVGVMPDSAEPDDEYPNLLLALGSLWLNGCDVDWAAFHEGESRRRTVLPAYAFQRRRFWIEPGGVQLASVPVAGSSLNRSAIVDQTEQGDERDAPGDPITRAIVGIVEELLGSKVESFDEDARFIMLGLDSLLLTQLARTVRVRLDFEVTFRDLVERYSTTKLLVGAIRAAGGGAAQSTKQPVAPIQPNHDGPIAAEVPMATTDASIITRLDGPVRGAKVGWDADGRLGWYLPDESRPGKYSKVVVQS